MTIWPVSGDVSQAYGSNPTQYLPADSWLIKTFGNYQPNGHTGVDFPVEVGTPVRAAASGVVRHVGWYTGSYADNPYWIAPSFAGFCLVIDHGAFVGIYAHLSSSPVNVGQQVQEGEIVAYSGNTGGSTGPHLHFEVLPDGWDFNNGMYGRVNPAQYITTGGAAIVPQSTTSTPTKPKPATDPLEEIMAYYTDRADFEAWQRRIVREEINKAGIPKSVWDHGTTAADGKTKTPMHRALRDPLNALVAAVAAEKGLSAEQLTTIIEQAIAKSVVTVDVTVNGKDAA